MFIVGHSVCHLLDLLVHLSACLYACLFDCLSFRLAVWLSAYCLSACVEESRSLAMLPLGYAVFHLLNQSNMSLFHACPSIAH